MNKTFYIAKLISTDIRSRGNANIIRSAIDGIEGNIILDFADVTFISRSFTDELYNILEEHKNITLINMSDFLDTMLKTVIQGRKNKRKLADKESEIKEFDDMNSLSNFLSEI